MACTGLAPPHPKCNEKKMFSKMPVLRGDGPLSSGQDTRFYCKEVTFSFILPGRYMLFFLQELSALHRCCPGFQVSMSIQSSVETREIFLWLCDIFAA